VHRVTTTHVRRSHLRTDRVGTGHLYQGIYRSFPIQTDNHLFTVLRYVERNPLRAGLVEETGDWAWSSFYGQPNSHCETRRPALSDWPIEKPIDWNSIVNTPLTMAEIEQVRFSVNHGRPYGNQTWQLDTAHRLGLASTLRPRGRPPKKRG
jgi:putative transposase